MLSMRATPDSISFIWFHHTRLSFCLLVRVPNFKFKKKRIAQAIFSLRSDSEDIRILWHSTEENHLWEVAVRKPNKLEIDRVFAMLPTINRIVNNVWEENCTL